MKKLLLLMLLLSGCASFEMPMEFQHKEYEKKGFIISLWEKHDASNELYHIYIEGDGNAFNSRGFPSKDPTPKSKSLRELAAKDKNPNVIYLARPCQFTKGPRCSEKYWTTARFAPEVVEAEYAAIKNSVNNAPVVLIGFSGGAQIAGLLAVTTDLNVKKVITIAGNLDHKSWTSFHKLPELEGSLNLADYKEKFSKIPQFHYIGENDKIIPPSLAREFLGNEALFRIIPDASHKNIASKLKLFDSLP